MILGALGGVGIAFIWLAVRLGRVNNKAVSKQPDSIEDAADEDVEHVFNKEFREELRNRGRLHFEKIIGENAMFLQQDLRLTTSQLNEYMKTEITRKLKEEFDKYEQSIMDAKQLAIDSIQKTNTAIDEERRVLGQQVQQEIAAEKQVRLERFEANMADIINHYVLAAIGNQIDLNDQLEYILADLEANKQAIIEDIQHGA
ncbi:MAG TPA: hypothetical protein VK712_01185 [Verrucomicrobiae bacterium]|nr:hypothetical protein [Verrucomicrobiae bacterium]